MGSSSHLTAVGAGVHLHTEQTAELKPKPIIISQAKLRWVMVCSAEPSALWQVISTLLPDNLFNLLGF